MFGYLQIQKDELLVREYDAYKAVYCGLCKQMGKDYSFLSRLTLSYDCTFYAMLLFSLHRSCQGFKKGRCVFNPLKSCNFADCKDENYSKAAAFSIISTYYKLKDDIADSTFLKSFACKIILPFFSRWRKKAAKKFPQIDALVSEMMKNQADEEKSKDSGVDSAAHPTAEMLGSLLVLEAEDEMQKKVYYEFGYHIGRWIYLIDAADDVEKDKKSGNFNPFIKESQTLDEQRIKAVLNQSLARAYDAYNLIDIKDFKGILDNMMLKGFPLTQNRVTDKLLKEEKNEQSI